jgi:N utilization substance protein B
VLVENYFRRYPQKKNSQHFCSLLVNGIMSKRDALDSVIKKHVKNWEIKRMAVVDRNILRIGCYELLEIEQIPPKVTINEAVELAKKFGDLDSSRFVNGILDKIYKKESKKISA